MITAEFITAKYPGMTQDQVDHMLEIEEQLELKSSALLKIVATEEPLPEVEETPISKLCRIDEPDCESCQ